MKFYELSIEEQINTLDENSGKMNRLGVSRRALHYLSAEAGRVSVLNHKIGFQLNTILLIAIDYLREKSYADIDFIAGAEWAADQIEAEKKDAAEKINQLVLENNRLSAALARLTEHIAELQKTLEK